MIDVEPYLSKRDIEQMQAYLAEESCSVECYIAQAATRQLEVDLRAKAAREGRAADALRTGPALRRTK